jgi:hypothetical protein
MIRGVAISQKSEVRSQKSDLDRQRLAGAISQKADLELAPNRTAELARTLGLYKVGEKNRGAVNSDF